MRIEELPGDPDGGRGADGEEDELLLPRREDGNAAEGESGGVIRVALDAKRAAVGVGARMLFYPTLVYNVMRNRFEEHFHWWDQIDEVRKNFFPFLIDVAVISLVFWWPRPIYYLISLGILGVLCVTI